MRTRREVLRDAAVALLAAGCAPDLLGAVDPDAGGAGADAGAGSADGPPRERPPDAAPDAAPPSGPVPEAPLAEFPLGIAAGDPTATGAILWTRYLGAAALELVVEDDVGEVLALAVEPSPDGFVHAPVTLPPGRYRYAFHTVLDGARATRSPWGRVGVGLSGPITIGAFSCTKNGRDFAALAQAARQPDLDVVLLLGDTTYADGATTLPDYRGRWAENLATPAYRALRARAPVVATWDDHDVDNNWNVEDEDPRKVAAARAALFEHLPITRSPEDPDRIWRRVAVTPDVDLFVLDCKGELRPSRDEHVSPAQLAFLLEGLAGSTARFKLVLTSVPIGEFPWLFSFVDARRWTGYPVQRSQVLDTADPIPGVIFLAGDFHLGSVGRVGEHLRPLEVLCGPGAQRANPLWPTLGDLFDFRTGTDNVTFLRLDPETGEVTIRFVDGAGATLFERTYTLA